MVSRILKKFEFSLQRRKISNKIVNLIIVICYTIILTGLWGVEKKDIAIFVSSLLTVVGVAFFAQWSLLSNITASMILFFNHPLKIGDRVQFLDKEVTIEGKITDITYYFLHLEDDNGHHITIPNNVVLQKVISVQPPGKTMSKTSSNQLK